MKVLKNFYCINSKKSYKDGEDYKGDRKDLAGFVEVAKKKSKAKKDV